MNIDLSMMQQHGELVKVAPNCPTRYRLELAGIPLGLDVVFKKMETFSIMEMGFGFEYSHGSWVIRSPIVVWSGTTWQEPYETKLGHTRLGKTVWHMGAGAKGIKGAEKLIIDFYCDKRFNWRIAKAYTDMAALHIAEAE